MKNKKSKISKQQKSEIERKQNERMIHAFKLIQSGLYTKKNDH